MNNQQKKMKKNYEQSIQRKIQNRTNVVATLLLLVTCLIGHARGMKKSVLTIFVSNPSEGLPYLIIVLSGVLIFYFVIWATTAKKYRQPK